MGKNICIFCLCLVFLFCITGCEEGSASNASGMHQAQVLSDYSLQYPENWEHYEYHQKTLAKLAE